MVEELHLTARERVKEVTVVLDSGKASGRMVDEGEREREREEACRHLRTRK